jgi:hypothetical protein
MSFTGGLVEVQCKKNVRVPLWNYPTLKTAAEDQITKRDLHATWRVVVTNPINTAHSLSSWQILLSCKNVAFISKQGEILNARGIINLLISPRICLSLNLQSDHIRSLRGCVTIRQSADGLDVPKIAKRLFWAPCLFRRWNGSLVTSKSPLEVCLFENQRTDPNLNFNNSSLNRTVREEVWE